MTSLYLALVAGLLFSQLSLRMRAPWRRERTGRALRPWVRLVDGLVAAALAWAVVTLVRLEVGGYVAPSLAALALAIGERVPLPQWLRTRRVAPLRSATLAGLYTALFWPLGLLWTGASALARLAAGRRRRLLRWVPVIEAAVAVGGGYLWGLPDAFLIVAFLLGTQQVALVLQHFLPTRWLVRRRPSEPRPRAPLVGRLIIFSGTVVGLGLYFLNLYVYHGFGAGAALFRRGNVDLPVVALTFDDGPNPLYTPAILDILKEHGVPATFFVVGREVEQYPDIARRIVAEGHEIGNHTYSHANLLGARPQTVEHEIVAANRAIEAVTGVYPHFFRPPRGVYTGKVLEVVRAEGQRVILYSLSSHDWLELSPRDIAQGVLRRVRPGDILLLHDSGDLIRNHSGDRSNTLRALPLIIEGLKERGYTLLTVGELLILSHLEMEGEEFERIEQEAGVPYPP